MLLIGAAVLLTTVAIVLLVGFYVLKLPFDDLLGVASGATGNPAILVYASAHGADGAAGHRLRHDLPLGDHREGHRGAGHRPDRPRRLTARGWSREPTAAGGDRGPAAARDRRQGGGGRRRQGGAGRHHAAHARGAGRRLHRLRRDLLQCRADRGRGRVPFGLARVVAGLVFALGLALVLLGGAQIFTGDVLMVMAWASGRLGLRSRAARLGAGLDRQPGRARSAQPCWCCWRSTTCSAAARSA